MLLQQRNDVIVIAETGSFNRAAERLSISQPSLSGTIKELERNWTYPLHPQRQGRNADCGGRQPSALCAFCHRAFLTLMERRACASRDSRLPHGTIFSRSRTSEPDPRLRRKYFGPGGCKNPSFGWPLPGGFATPVLRHSMPDVAQFRSDKRKTRTNTIVRDFLWLHPNKDTNR